MIFSFYSNRITGRTSNDCIAFAILALLPIFFRPAPCLAETTAFMLVGPDDTEMCSLNKTTPMIPASTLKLLTSLTALKTLGPSYRFNTLIAYSPKTHRLFLKGQGDPLLISEELRRLGERIITSFHPERISDIIIDTSFFSPDITIPGTGRSTNPYDATTGALCANFNTFRFKWSQHEKTFISAEPQTPLLNILKKDIRNSGLKNGRILLAEPIRKIYPGLLLAHFIKENHIPVTGKIISSSFCEACTPVIKFESNFSLDEVLEKLLAFSNNFMANQIMLAMGANAFGPPATLEKGTTYLKDFAKKNLLLQDIKLVEGSGLSRQNRITAAHMIRILKAFKPYHRLLRLDGNDFYKQAPFPMSDVVQGILWEKKKSFTLMSSCSMRPKTGLPQFSRNSNKRFARPQPKRLKTAPPDNCPTGLFQYRRMHCGCGWIQNSQH